MGEGEGGRWREGGENGTCNICRRNHRTGRSFFCLLYSCTPFCVCVCVAPDRKTDTISWLGVGCLHSFCFFGRPTNRPVAPGRGREADEKRSG